VAAAQEIATSPAPEPVTTLCQPAGGLDDSTAPLLSAAKQAAVVGQEIPVMTALLRNGSTGIGPAQPGSWAGMLDGAGDVPPAGALGPADGVVLALATGGPSGAVSLAA